MPPIEAPVLERREVPVSPEELKDKSLEQLLQEYREVAERERRPETPERRGIDELQQQMIASLQQKIEEASRVGDTNRLEEVQQLLVRAQEFERIRLNERLGSEIEAFMTERLDAYRTIMADKIIERVKSETPPLSLQKVLDFLNQQNINQQKLISDFMLTTLCMRAFARESYADLTDELVRTIDAQEEGVREQVLFELFLGNDFLAEESSVLRMIESREIIDVSSFASETFESYSKFLRDNEMTDYMPADASAYEQLCNEYGIAERLNNFSKISTGIELNLQDDSERIISSIDERQRRELEEYTRLSNEIAALQGQLEGKEGDEKITLEQRIAELERAANLSHARLENFEQLKAAIRSVPQLLMSGVAPTIGFWSNASRINLLRGTVPFISDETENSISNFGGRVMSTISEFFGEPEHLGEMSVGTGVKYLGFAAIASSLLVNGVMAGVRGFNYLGDAWGDIKNRQFVSALGNIKNAILNPSVTFLTGALIPVGMYFGIRGVENATQVEGWIRHALSAGGAEFERITGVNVPARFSRTWEEFSNWMSSNVGPTWSSAKETALSFFERVGDTFSSLGEEGLQNFSIYLSYYNLSIEQLNEHRAVRDQLATALNTHFGTGSEIVIDLEPFDRFIRTYLARYSSENKNPESEQLSITVEELQTAGILNEEQGAALSGDSSLEPFTPAQPLIIALRDRVQWLDQHFPRVTQPA